MSVQLLNEHRCEFLRLKGGYTGSSESPLVKMPHCWKSHFAAQLCLAAQKNCLIEMTLLSAHNICFGLETRKLWVFFLLHTLK